jgi:outer membrane protein assembly factor BamB
LGYDGSELWTFEPNKVGGVVDAAIFASPAIGADGTVYIAGLYDPNLYALDPNDGSVKWDCNFGSVGGAFASPVVAPDGTIYQTLLFDANLYAIDPNTGAILWSADMADSESGWFDSDYVDTRDYVDGWYEPAVGPDGTIYVTFNDPYLRAVDANGNIMWVARLGMTGSFSLAVGNDGLVYAAGEDGYLCAVDAGGQELARFEGEELGGQHNYSQRCERQNLGDQWRRLRERDKRTAQARGFGRQPCCEPFGFCDIGNGLA